MDTREDDRWDELDDEVESRSQTRAEELAEELDIPLEEAEKIAYEEGADADEDEVDLGFDSLRFGGSD
jgi:hypothetical protein